MPKNINLYSQSKRYKRGRVFCSSSAWKETSILKLQMLYVLLILLFIFVCAFPLVIMFFDLFYKKFIEMRLFWEKKVTDHLPLELVLSSLNPHHRHQSSHLYFIICQLLWGFLLSQTSGFHPVFSSLISTI